MEQPISSSAQIAMNIHHVPASTALRCSPAPGILLLAQATQISWWEERAPTKLDDIVCS
jgi:hypothetical protein